MQRVVRSTLVGILTVAGLTACGDKITIPPVTTTPASNVVRGVTVAPSQVTVAVGGTAQLAASVDADAGVSVRTVAWSSSNTAIATVDATTGLVTGRAAGSAQVVAKATADPNVQGAATVTVTPAGGGTGATPTVIITGINQNPTNTPVNVTAAAGQLDVILDVNTNGAQLRSVSATLACPGSTTMTQTQTISGAASDVDGAAVPVVLSFPTATYNTTTGVPQLRNGACTLTATATTGTSTTQTAQTTTQITLANADAVHLTTSFTGYANAEGVTTLTQATDAGGLPWRGGNVTVSALPVLYSGRTLSSVSITLPGANTPTQTVTAAPFSATWSATSTTAPNVTRLTLVGGGFEANGTTPTGITPSVVVLDNAGNDLNVTVANAGIVGQTTFRLDNTPPQAPTTFVIAQRQFGWTNASYTFTGSGGASFGATGTTKYVSCGDGPVAAGAGACQAQIGVSAAAVSGTSGLNGQTTFSFYAIPAASYTAASTAQGTNVTATTCSVASPWVKITSPADLAETLVNTAYVVRAFEMDKLLNARCTDLAAAQNTINGGAFANGTFGVDKTAPSATLVAGGTPECTAVNGCTTDLQRINTNPVPNFFVTYLDNPLASGFSTTPLITTLTRLAINPATGAASTTSTAFGCPIGFSANSATCSLSNGVQAGGTIAADAGSPAGTSSGIDGYYTYTAQIVDNARNPGNTVTRTVVVDRVAPTLGGIAVPATLVGGSSASFATSATDNLDLVSTNYTLAYAITPTNAAQQLNIRANGNDIGVAFDNALTTSVPSFSLNVPFFIRTIATTTAGGAPQNNAAFASQISVRVQDAANNTSAPGVAPIQFANISQTTPVTNFTAAQSNGANFTGTGFSVSNAVANVSNCPTATCAGGVAPANATSVTLTATAQGTEQATAPAFQFQSPFTQVQFYYLDTGYAGASNEWILIGSSGAPSGSDNATQTVRTYNWSISFDPPAALGSGAPLRVIAVGVNANGDALATAQNSNITLTNP